MIRYAPRFGLGNIVQTTPTVRYLQTFHTVQIVADPAYREFIDAVFGPEFEIVPPSDSIALVNCVPTDFVRGGNVSEVRENLRRVGAPPGAERKGFCHTEPVDEHFDVVLCDGYNKRNGNGRSWLVKSYAHWPAVVMLLKQRGLTVASVGHPSELIPGTVDMTHLSLAETFGLISNARYFMSNDTGLYHVACALGTPTIVVFTMSDTTKNYDSVFHASAKLLQAGLPCQPCQLRGPVWWVKNEPICKWACRQELPPERIVECL